VKTILSPNQRAAVKLKNLINFETHAIRDLRFQMRYYKSYFQRPIAPKRIKYLEAVSCLLAGILVACSTHATGTGRSSTVFVILMENHNWLDIKGNPDAPYINHSLLPLASYAEHYFNPPGVHPSEPNYLRLEAGTNFGILNDDPPPTNHQSTPRHFVTLLKNSGIFMENLSGKYHGINLPDHRYGVLRRQAQSICLLRRCNGTWLY